MNAQRIPVALADRLGHDATLDLIDLLKAERADWREQVLSVSADRFERRLTEEISKVRVELHDGLAGVRQELASVRVEYLRWSFLFWAGQLAAMAGLLAFMFRATGRP
jgi:hypothetical protein